MSTKSTTHQREARVPGSRAECRAIAQSKKKSEHVESSTQPCGEAEAERASVCPASLLSGVQAQPNAAFWEPGTFAFQTHHPPRQRTPFLTSRFAEEY